MLQEIYLYRQLAEISILFIQEYFRVEEYFSSGKHHQWRNWSSIETQNVNYAYLGDLIVFAK